MAREPGYCLHKPTGLAYVNLGGKVIYLGKHGSGESLEAYNRVKAEWLVNRHSPEYSPNSSGPTMADVCLAYLDHAKTYYPTGNEYANLVMAIKPISKFYATLPASQFGPVHFRTIRDWWIKTPIEFARSSKSDPKAKSKPPRFRSRKTVNESQDSQRADEQTDARYEVGSRPGNDTGNRPSHFEVYRATQGGEMRSEGNQAH